MSTLLFVLLAVTVYRPKKQEKPEPPETIPEMGMPEVLPEPSEPLPTAMEQLLLEQPEEAEPKPEA